jgi:hypothetical protein
MKGGFEELGQLVFNRKSFTENTTLAPKMYYNPQGWTQKSTMLYAQYSTVQYSTVQYSTVQYSTVLCCANERLLIEGSCMSHPDRPSAATQPAC